MGKTAKKAIDVTAPGKLYINRSRVAEDHYEYRYLPPLFIRVDILTNPPIYLSPFTWFCFIPDSSSLLFRWSEWLNVILYDCVTTRKHCSRNFSRMTLQLNTPSLIHRSIAGLKRRIFNGGGSIPFLRFWVNYIPTLTLPNIVSAKDVPF